MENTLMMVDKYQVKLAISQSQEYFYSTKKPHCPKAPTLTLLLFSNSVLIVMPHIKQNVNHDTQAAISTDRVMPEKMAVISQMISSNGIILVCFDGNSTEVSC